MRQTISGLVAALAVVTVSTAPALACGGVGCAPCGPVVAGPCGGAAYVSGEFGYGYGPGAAAFEHLPDPTRYYYVNQGPAFDGPGNFAPVPTYSERSVSGWRGYRDGFVYHGGIYADAMTHHYVGAPMSGAAIYRYHRHRHPWHHRRHMRQY
jgi:hypothetical protein